MRNPNHWIQHTLGALAALGATLAGAPAGAQPSRPSAATVGMTEVEGAVLAVQGDDLVLDLGATRGATSGATVALWRPIKLKHPVTGKVLTDRFRIGELTLTQVQKTMALARATGALARPAQAGDVVILDVWPQAPVASSAPRTAGAPTPGAATPGTTPPGAKPEPAATTDDGGPSPAPTASVPEDPEAHAVTTMFDALHGADLWTRIQRYEQHVRSHPGGRFAGVLGEEAAALRELLAGRGKATSADGPALISFTPPAEARAGDPLRITLELDGAPAGAVLQLRRKGAPSYAPLPMRALGNGYFAVDVPADRLVPPLVEYFIEAIDSAGKATVVVGRPDAPEELAVFEAPRPAAPRRLASRAELSTDYADYNRLRGNDYTSQTEGLFGVRYGDVGVRAVRLGFGVYRGVGGSVDDLDNKGLAPRHVGLTYGWLEAEFGFVRAFSMGGRVAVGLLDSGISGGGQVMFRVGSDLGTNLVVSGEVLGGLGLRGAAQLELATFARVPIMLRTEVTNQPAGVTPSAPAAGTSTGSSDIGGRGIVQVGFKFTPDFMVALRGSFEGRTIQHAGPGLGGAVGYTW